MRVDRIRQKVALALLIAALLLFAAFHFLPVGTNSDDGGDVWRGLWRLLQRPQRLWGMPDSVVMITSFLTFTLLIVASPFLTNVWMKSRLARGLVTTFSGLAAAGFWVMYFLRGEYRDLGVGGWCLLISTVVNFAGLLLVRGNTLKSATMPHGRNEMMV